MKISVCMATYNGSAFIEQQLRSILFQLKQNDEIILVDDHSSDNTLDVVKSLHDPRIKIHPGSSNEGVIKAFERAIRLATGGVIFLSDQDDIWNPEKVSKVMEVFERRQDVTLVVSDAKVIDADGNVLAPSFFQIRGRFVANALSNIIKNKYLGCTMVFRASIVRKILPFPADIPMHDMWIGCVNVICGRVHFIDSPLIQYRRHKSNATSGKRQGISKMIYWRLALVKNLCLTLLRKR